MASNPLQTLMVAVDMSDVAHQAFEQAIALAKALNAKLIIAHVLSSQDSDRPEAPFCASNPEAISIDAILLKEYEAALKQCYSIVKLFCRRK